MSLTLIVIIATVCAVLIGIKVYLEYKEEKELESKKQEDVFQDLTTFIVNPLENPVIEKPKVETTPAPIEPILEVKVKEQPKKKYVKKKPAIKAKTKKK